MVEFIVKILVYEETLIFNLIPFLIRGLSGDHLGIEHRLLIEHFFMNLLDLFFFWLRNWFFCFFGRMGEAILLRIPMILFPQAIPSLNYWRTLIWGLAISIVQWILRTDDDFKITNHRKTNTKDLGPRIMDLVLARTSILEEIRTWY